ncbi:unnamed protein product [Polarella glacialis]|uniref:ADP,ATP carrier protein n=1 Tax=Polarella glacialis TaxID=89957 RepID=A0A813F7U5_POLGL|nr:unnamed protein product [Polarella glacialis]
MGAGAVASVIQAALSAVGEPIVNRVLVKRMKVMDAVRDVKPSMMLDFFKTTLATNFLKFPFFEAINAFCSMMPISPSVRGFVTGLVFTTATLPVTNYRYRKSMQLEVNCGDLYEAYLPTVIRDIAYGIVRNYGTIAALHYNPQWTAQSPWLLFIVVIIGCLGSAPFNEWRGFLLQSKGQELSFKDFFKPSNFVRSTGLGAFKQGLALAVGYWCAPPVQKFVRELMRAAFSCVQVLTMLDMWHVDLGIRHFNWAHSRFAVQEHVTPMDLEAGFLVLASGEADVASRGSNT